MKMRSRTFGWPVLAALAFNLTGAGQADVVRKTQGLGSLLRRVAAHSDGWANQAVMFLNRMNRLS